MSTQSILRAAVALIVVGAVGVVCGSESWQSLGPEGGQVLTLAVSPSNDSVVYAGTPAGVYRSDDGGSSWRLAGLVEQRVLALAVDPESTDTVYAGVSARVSGKGGVWQSRDGGHGWVPMRSGLEDSRASDWFLAVPFLRVGVDPTGASRLWAGTSRGLFVSLATDGIWTPAGSPVDTEVTALEVDSANPGRLMVAVNRASGLYRSTDHGTSWSQVAAAVFGPHPENPKTWPVVSQIVVAPSDPSRVYACSSDTFFASHDGGVSWAEVAQFELPYDAGVRALAVDLHDARTVVAGTALDGVLETNDGGATWRQVGDGLECSQPVWEVNHARALAIAIAESGTRILLGTERKGVFLRKAEGGVWQASSSGLVATSPSDIVFAPLDPSVVLVTTQMLGMHRSTDSGASWSPSNAGIDGDCGPLDFVPMSGPDPFCRALGDVVWLARDGSVLAASECGVLRSLDGGRSWIDLDHWPSAGPLVAADRGSSTVYSVFYGTRVRRSDDGGWSWRDCADVPGQRRIGAMAVSPDGGTLVVGTAGGVYHSRDGGLSWQGPAEPDDPVLSLAFLDIQFTGHQGNVLYASSTRGVYRSADLGETWHSAGLTDSNVTALAVRGGTIFAATGSDGVWVSHDAGAAWTPMSQGLDNLSIVSLTLSPDARRLFAATNGTGLFVIDVPSPPRRLGGRTGRPGPAPSTTEIP